jgi:multidrug efflux pump subunit AcrB
MCSKGDIKSIEVTAYATSYGNSENNRENAFTVAEMKAKAKLRHFIYEDVSSTRTVNTIAKNVEKANDNIKSKIKADEVELSDNDADPNANVSVRENTNDTVRTLTESIRSQAQGILKGVYIKDEKIVDRQTVQVTIRWDKDSNRGSEQLQRLFR